MFSSLPVTLGASRMQAQLAKVERRHEVTMSKTTSRSREIEQSIRELEKQNSLFRSAILSRDLNHQSEAEDSKKGHHNSHNVSAVTYTEAGRTCQRTGLLHEALSQHPPPSPAETAPPPLPPSHEAIYARTPENAGADRAVLRGPVPGSKHTAWSCA